MILRCHAVVFAISAKFRGKIYLANEILDGVVWYPYFDQFAELLRHKNSLVRNRAISILSANARWDADGKFDALLDEFLSHVTDANSKNSKIR